MQRSVTECCIERLVQREQRWYFKVLHIADEGPLDAIRRRFRYLGKSIMIPRGKSLDATTDHVVAIVDAQHNALDAHRVLDLDGDFSAAAPEVYDAVPGTGI